MSQSSETGNIKEFFKLSLPAQDDNLHVKKEGKKVKDNY